MSVRTDDKLGLKSVETNDWNPGFGQNVKRGVVMKPRNRDVLRVLGCVWIRLDKVAPIVTVPPSALVLTPNSCKRHKESTRIAI